MENHLQVSTDTTSSVTVPQLVHSRWLSIPRLHHLAPATATWLRHRLRSIGSVLISDWRTHKHVLFALLLLCITTIVVVAYYLNHPQFPANWETRGYLAVAQQIQVRGQVVDAWLLPGYPLLIVLVYVLAGQDNLFAVSVVQALLFVLATLELYILAALLLRRSWLAFLIGLLVGPNLTLLFYVKLIMSEALALWLLVSLALAVALFVYTLRARALWLVAIFTLALLLTRAEWIYLPVPLFAYLLLMAACRGVARRLLPHTLLALVLLYAVLGDYVYINAQLNHFAGVAESQNINAFGKVLQYDMQDEAPPQYATITRRIDTFLAQAQAGERPIDILAREPSLVRNGCALCGEYAWAIIKRHPGEFLAKSMPLAHWSLMSFYSEYQVDATGMFGGPLVGLEFLFRRLYGWNLCFPLCAALWLLLLCRRRTRTIRSVQMMGAVVLLTLYGLILTTLGGIDSYPRLHTPFNPLLILVVWGTLLMGAQFVVRHLLRLRARLVDHYSARDE